MQKLKPKNQTINNEDDSMLTKAEEIVLAEQRENDLINSANTERMETFLTIIKHRFKIDDDFSVIGFDDKGKDATIKIQNDDFIISVKAKDTERLPMPTIV